MNDHDNSQDGAGASADQLEHSEDEEED